mmetsp:Transcript_33092/g.91420  ORF Transcript_33092/g.91420 Transcript_33092/m.91420 type:complete len:209 (-) Transcript_33092:155-781(-)|eukprot:CAMPEP_0179064222 /NCGR_PEP_ID=MMETSP0796-20121207/27837_1 /TAXON_ID=73915 /ORGANISM="Pyrodinium bahamense, Strain pbaha01" /LENGTH=208 /DNA_ID=CAMNT_0020761163 /DNA_START=79 /DNA_END=705 /DNA_ORIENTATION=+
MARSTRGERIRALRTIFQGLGALVCIAFALQGILIFVGPIMGHRKPPLEDFFEAAHWASEGALCVLFGFGGFVLEMRACFPSVAAHFVRLLGNRLVLSIGYLWLGAYSMGGRIQQGGEVWRQVGQITGFVAWVVSAGDLLISCCSDWRQPSSAEAKARTPTKFEDRDRAASDSTTPSDAEVRSEATSGSGTALDAPQRGPGDPDTFAV